MSWFKSFHFLSISLSLSRHCLLYQYPFIYLNMYLSNRLSLSPVPLSLSLSLFHSLTHSLSVTSSLIIPYLLRDSALDLERRDFEGALLDSFLIGFVSPALKNNTSTFSSDRRFFWKSTHFPVCKVFTRIMSHMSRSNFQLITLTLRFTSFECLLYIFERIRQGQVTNIRDWCLETVAIKY